MDYPVTILEVTPTGIAALEATMERKALVIMRVLRRPCEGGASEQAGVLREMFGGGAPGGTVVAILPRRQVTMVLLRLPTREETELAQMAELQMMDHVPHAREDVIIRHRVVEKEASGYSRVLAMAVRREEVARYLDVLRRAGVHPRALVLRSEGLRQWYAALKRPCPDDGVEVVVDWSPWAVEVCFLQGETVIFSREIKGETDEARVMDQLALTMATYRKQRMGPKVVGVVLVRADATEDRLGPGLQEVFGCPVEAVSPLAPLPHAQVEGSPEAGLAGLLGVALAPSGPYCDFLPSEVAARKKTRQARRDILTGAGLLGVAMGFALAGGAARFYRRALYADFLREAFEKRRPVVREIRRTERRLRDLRRRLDQRVLVVDVLEAITTLMPADVALRVLDLDEQRTLTLEGEAEDEASVNRLTSRMVAFERFSGVRLQYTKKRRTARGEKVLFRLTGRVEAAKIP